MLIYLSYEISLNYFTFVTIIFITTQLRKVRCKFESGVESSDFQLIFFMAQE